MNGANGLPGRPGRDNLIMGPRGLPVDEGIKFVHLKVSGAMGAPGVEGVKGPQGMPGLRGKNGIPGEHEL